MMEVTGWGLWTEKELGKEKEEKKFLQTGWRENRWTLKVVQEVKLKLTQMEKVFIKISLNNEISQQYLYWTWVQLFSGLLTKRRNPEKMIQIVSMVMVITQVVTVILVEMG